MFSYSGWNAATYVAEEVRNPSRNVPLALGLGTVAVIVLYAGLNALYLYAMPIDQLAALPGARLLDSVADRLFRDGGRQSPRPLRHRQPRGQHQRDGARGPARVFRDGARRHVRARRSARASALPHAGRRHCAQGLWSSVLVLSGTQAQLVNYTGFAVVLFTGVTVSALFVLRRRNPSSPRPFSALGYPWAPAIFVIASALMVLAEAKRTGWTTVVGVALIGLGVPVYYMIRARG
jgi:APA family basic amino acid/polyamine antiporter